jgi:nucleotide-binding universal stress UspA family protein
MKQFKNILVATDTRFDSNAIVDEAADIASHCGATLKIVDVIPEFPWTMRLTVRDYQHLQDLVWQEKQKKLDALAARARKQCVDVEAKLLHGKTSIEIIREVIRSDHDLVLRVIKGTESRRKAFFGTTGMRLLRKCPCAVWLVKPTRTQFEHVLGCIDTTSEGDRDLELNEMVYDLAESISHYHGGKFSIVHAWWNYDELFLKRRMEAEEFAEMERKKLAHITLCLNRFLCRHGSSANAENVHLIKGEVHDVISSFIPPHGVDLVVMGTVARSGVSGMIMGNTAEKILDELSCSVLALKPSGFVSPIQLDG